MTSASSASGSPGPADTLAAAERRLAEIRARLAAGRATSAELAAATELARAVEAMRAAAELAPAAARVERAGALVAVADIARRDALSTWLDDAGLRVVATGSASAARALVRATPDAFTLVVTDVELADGSGLGLATEVRQLRPDVPMVLMSAAPPDSVVSRLPWTETGGETLVLERAVSRERLLAVAQALVRNTPPRS